MNKETPTKEIKFPCIHCQQNISAGLESAGIETNCPTCGGEITVPNDRLSAITNIDNPSPSSRNRFPKGLLNKFNKLSKPLKLVTLICLGFTSLVIIAAFSTAITSNNDNPATIVAKMEKEFSTEINKETAELYLIGYNFGENGFKAFGAEQREPDFEKQIPSIISTNPNLTPAQKQVMLAGLDDGKSGRANRLKGIDLNTLKPTPMVWPLSVHCQRGNLAKVMTIANSSNVNELDDSGLPLCEACSKGQLHVAKYLLSIGAKIDKPDGYGRYPIHHAAENGNIKLFKFLVNSGAKLNQKSGTPYLDKLRMDSEAQRLTSRAGGNSNPVLGFQPIHIASQHKNIEIVKFLLDKGIPYNVKTNHGSTPLDYYRRYDVWTNKGVSDLGRMLDKNGSYEKLFNTAVGNSSSIIRSNGIYLRMIKDSEQFGVTHCLKFYKDGSVKFESWNASFDPEKILKSFKGSDKGTFTLENHNLKQLRVNIKQSDYNFEGVKGQADGDTISFKSTNPQSYFDNNGGANRVIYKFHPESPVGVFK